MVTASINRFDRRCNRADGRMKVVCNRYAGKQAMEIDRYLKNKKLKKYFNRETTAAIAAVGQMLEETLVDPTDVGLYYSTGFLEYEDYGLAAIATRSIDDNHRFSIERFVTDALVDVSPLNQFKVLLNMPVACLAIAFGFTGDNAVVYASAQGLLACAKTSPAEKILIGAGRGFRDGAVETAFALGARDEFADMVADNDYDAQRFVQSLDGMKK